jgi:hypothetical protein
VNLILSDLVNRQYAKWSGPLPLDHFVFIIKNMTSCSGCQSHLRKWGNQVGSITTLLNWGSLALEREC